MQGRSTGTTRTILEASGRRSSVRRGSRHALRGSEGSAGASAPCVPTATETPTDRGSVIWCDREDRLGCRASPSRRAGAALTASSRGSPSGRSAIAWAARRRRSRRTSTTHLMLTKDPRIAPRANAGLGAPRAAYGASQGTRSPRASAGQNARRHGVAAQPFARSRPALERTPGALHARVRIAAPRRRSGMARPGRQRRL